MLGQVPGCWVQRSLALGLAQPWEPQLAVKQVRGEVQACWIEESLPLGLAQPQGQLGQ